MQLEIASSVSSSLWSLVFPFGGRLVNRSQKLREVFAELKEFYGETVSAGELLRVASALLEAYQKVDVEQYGDFGYPRREPFFFYEVDRAMLDGGWRVLNSEYRTGMELSDELPDSYWAVQAKVQKVVGQLQWPRIAME